MRLAEIIKKKKLIGSYNETPYEEEVERFKREWDEEAGEIDMMPLTILFEYLNVQSLNPNTIKRMENNVFPKFDIELVMIGKRRFLKRVER